MLYEVITGLGQGRKKEVRAHEEEGRAAAAGLDGVQGGFAAGLLSGAHGPDHGGQPPHRAGGEEHLGGKPHVQFLLDAGQGGEGRQGVSAELEKVVVRAYLGKSYNFV